MAWSIAASRSRSLAAPGERGYALRARFKAKRSRRDFSSGMRRHSVSHLAVFSVSIPSSSASTWAATAEGARPITVPSPCSSSQAALRPAMVVDFPLPAETETHCNKFVIGCRAKRRSLLGCIRLSGSVLWPRSPPRPRRAVGRRRIAGRLSCLLAGDVHRHFGWIQREVFGRLAA